MVAAGRGRGAQGGVVVVVVVVDVVVVDVVGGDVVGGDVVGGAVVGGAVVGGVVGRVGGAVDAVVGGTVVVVGAVVVVGRVVVVGVLSSSPPDAASAMATPAIRRTTITMPMTIATRRVEPPP
jgi:hypothetical protein